MLPACVEILLPFYFASACLMRLRRARLSQQQRADGMEAMPAAAMCVRCRYASNAAAILPRYAQREPDFAAAMIAFVRLAGMPQPGVAAGCSAGSGLPLPALTSA